MWCLNCCHEQENSFCNEMCENSYNFHIIKTGPKNVNMYPHRHVLKHFGGILTNEEYKNIPDGVSYNVGNIPFVFTVERKDPNTPIIKKRNYSQENLMGFVNK